MDWSPFYPAFAVTPTEEDITEDPELGAVKAVTPLLKDVEVADIGCGFGGLLVALAPVLPDTLLLGKTRSETPLIFSFWGDIYQASIIDISLEV